MIVKVAKPTCRTCDSMCPSSAWRGIDAMKAAGADALAVDAGKTFFIDGEACRRRRKHAAGIVVVGRAGMSEPLRVATIGVGHLGRHHARLLATIAERAALVAAVDLEARAGPAPRPALAGCRGAGRLSAASGRARGRRGRRRADRCAPRQSRRRFSSAACTSLSRSRWLRRSRRRTPSLSLARPFGRTLAVGHTERFNPAVAAALPAIQSPRFIEVHRLSNFPERSLDIDVVFDVMIHDLDIILAVDGSLEVVSVEAVGIKVLTPHVDIANARIRFASGCVANITASRISRDKVRKVRFCQPSR